MKFDASNNRTIDTNFLKIYGNCLEVDNTSIQLSNVSLFSTIDIAAAAFPVWSIVLLIIGLAFFSFNKLIALALLACGAVWIYLWYNQSQKSKTMKRLMIATNSGNVFNIVFNNQAFLQQVVRVLNAVISEPSNHSVITVDVKGNAFLDVKGNTFRDGASVVQHLNEYAATGKKD